MTKREVLDKQINKKPFLCQLGLHRYKSIIAYFTAGRMFIVSRCVRCDAEMTEVRK